jgi:hypothetical protein
MRSKREGILFLIFILFCILATGFYDRVLDDNNLSEEAQISKDGYEDFDYSICKIKDLLGGIHSFQALRLVTGFYFIEILEKASFESHLFLSFFSYRGPPSKILIKST